jgi:anthranilate/para-aminobenzoate synthase component I
LPADPIAIARSLEAGGAPGLALLHSAEAPRASRSFVAAFPDRESDALDPFEPSDRDASAAPRWIGVLPYDALRGDERAGWSPPDTRPKALLDTPRWLRYPAVLVIDHESGRVLAVGDDDASIDRLATAAARAPSPLIEARIEAEDDEPLARHAERIAAAKELIGRGDLYQVNLARRIVVRLRGGSPLSFYERLATVARPSFGACITFDRGLQVLSTSPELALAASVDPASISGAFARLETRPIKGTRPRGDDAESDARLREELEHDAKERAELAMIVDVERNDLGRVARAGSVRVVTMPRVITHRTVHHRVADIVARARESASREEVLRSMLPSGSVTGAPKIRAMEVIRSLEPRRRGLYTGALGYVARDGSVALAMAIRVVTLRDHEGEYWTGGGIVIDSDPAREVEETRWKAAQLARISR